MTDLKPFKSFYYEIKQQVNQLFKYVEIYSSKLCREILVESVRNK